GKRLTYQELNERANQLAHYLRRRGVGPEVLVGICVERSLEMIIGLLGILKAGGAYVPLDANYPAERLRYMVENAGVKVLVSQEKWMEQWQGYEGTVVNLERESVEIGQESGSNCGVGLMGDNAAYVIYTSGSSGKPKGTVVSHRNVVRLFRATEQRF